MATKKKIVKESSKPSSEAEAVGRAFSKATKLARTRAFKNKKRKSILVEYDGYLVRVNKEGKVIRRVKKLELVIIPQG